MPIDFYRYFVVDVRQIQLHYQTMVSCSQLEFVTNVTCTELTHSTWTVKAALITRQRLADRASRLGYYRLRTTLYYYMLELCQQC